MLLSTKASNIWDNVAIVLTKHRFDEGEHETFENWKNIGEDTV